MTAPLKIVGRGPTGDEPNETSAKQLGLLVAIASWGMLFSTFILSFLLYRARLPVWPPIGTEAIPKLLPSVATALLVASSFFIHAAYRQLAKAEHLDFRRFWNVGTLLGLMFLVCQLSTWSHMMKMGVTLQSNFFASIYYTMTGLHALHVVGGLGVLGWIALRADKYGPKKTLAPQLASWFWHFMDAVWIVMFIVMVL